MKEKEICWNITTRCNQNCKYCHRFLNIQDLSFERNKNILDNLINNGVKAITWTGGEALLLTGLDDLLEISWAKGIKNKLITNGKLLNMDRIKKIADYLDTITISLDTIDNTTNEKIGRGYNHYDTIKNVLDNLKKYPKIKIQINTVLNKYNLNQISDLIKFLNNYNIYNWRIFKFMPLREQAIHNKNEFDITQEEFLDAIEVIKKKSIVHNLDYRIEEDMENKYILILANGDIVVTESGKDIKIGNALSEKLDLCYNE